MTTRLDTIERETAPNPDAAIIWMHGLGADGHDFEPIVPELRLQRRVRFVFPHAPVRPVTINGGYRMRAWYDIYAFGRDAREDEAGIRTSAAAVGRLIDREVGRGLDPDRIVLAGFSKAVRSCCMQRYARRAVSRDCSRFRLICRWRRRLPRKRVRPMQRSQSCSRTAAMIP